MTCPNCGGNLVGDGYTVVLHCETIEVPSVEPDGHPVFCADQYVMEILDPVGHLTLTWNPDDDADVKRAKDEFNRLKAAGFSFFATIGESATPVKRLGDTGTLTVDRITEFKPKRRRTVAVRPMQGG
jgi:hypothetical protein